MLAGGGLTVLDIEVAEGVATLWLARPDRGNALGDGLVAAGQAEAGAAVGIHRRVAAVAAGAGDAEKLAVLMHEQEDDPDVMEALMFRRNRAWADWISDRLKQPGEVFLAVGAGHLAGPGSVQEELATRGVQTRRVQ